MTLRDTAAAAMPTTVAAATETAAGTTDGELTQSPYSLPPPPVTPSPQQEMTPEEGAQRVTIWNRVERRKIAGNAAPLRKNLVKYLRRNPEWEEYVDQDLRVEGMVALDSVTGLPVVVKSEHVVMWDTLKKRKVCGNAAPLRQNLEIYLRNHPGFEIYSGQDKDPDQPLLTPPSALAAAPGFAPGHVSAPIPEPSRSPVGERAQTALGPKYTPFTPSLPQSTASKAAPTNSFSPYNLSAFSHPSQTQQSLPLPPAHKIVRPEDLPYEEQASSWSNLPQWKSALNQPPPRSSENTAWALAQLSTETASTPVPDVLTRPRADGGPGAPKGEKASKGLFDGPPPSSLDMVDYDDFCPSSFQTGKGPDSR